MLTVSQLAKRCGLSRSTILYYESIGLLTPPSRSPAGYRRYGERDLRRLEQIRAYRDAGLTLQDARELLTSKSGQMAILRRRFFEIDGEIAILRKHQQAILHLQQNQNKGDRKDMTKEKWTDIMRATGFSDDDMKRWHSEFERSAPEDHQQFLEFLHIGPEEITHIRGWSRAGASKA